MYMEVSRDLLSDLAGSLMLNRWYLSEGPYLEVFSKSHLKLSAEPFVLVTRMKAARGVSKTSTSYSNLRLKL